MKIKKLILSALIFSLFGCSGFSSGNSLSNQNSQSDSNNGETMKIKVSDGKNEINFELNDSAQSKALYEQVSSSIEVQVSNYSSNEKIFYPPQKLPVQNGIEGSGGEGVLAYFSPWGNVVMFYGNFSRYPGLFILGKATNGADRIKNLSGKITVTTLDAGEQIGLGNRNYRLVELR